MLARTETEKRQNETHYGQRYEQSAGRQRADAITPQRCDGIEDPDEKSVDVRRTVFIRAVLFPELNRQCPSLLKISSIRLPPAGRPPPQPDVKMFAAEISCRNPYSCLMPADLMTLAHFLVSAAMKWPKSVGELRNTPPTSASRAFRVGSARQALIAELSLSMISVDSPWVRRCHTMHCLVARDGFVTSW